MKNNKLNLEYENNNVHGIFHEEFFTNRKIPLNNNSTASLANISTELKYKQGKGNSNLHNADKIDAIKEKYCFYSDDKPDSILCWLG